MRDLQDKKPKSNCSELKTYRRILSYRALWFALFQFRFRAYAEYFVVATQPCRCPLSQSAVAVHFFAALVNQPYHVKRGLHNRYIDLGLLPRCAVGSIIWRNILTFFGPVDIVRKSVISFADAIQWEAYILHWVGHPYKLIIYFAKAFISTQLEWSVHSLFRYLVVNFTIGFPLLRYI